MKKIWGPIYWNYLHNVAIKYPDKPTIQQRLEIMNTIYYFLNSIPCELCKCHAIEYVAQNQINVQSSHLFQRWAWSFHNSVNSRIDKTYFMEGDYMRKYNALAFIQSEE